MQTNKKVTKSTLKKITFQRKYLILSLFLHSKFDKMTIFKILTSIETPKFALFQPTLSFFMKYINLASGSVRVKKQYYFSATIL
jgi:hypothetical protein